MKSFSLLAVRFYQQALSPFLPHACRFTPSCSSYCLEAVGRYGVVRGFLLSLKRIARCWPLSPGGYDPVK